VPPILFLAQKSPSKQLSKCRSLSEKKIGMVLLTAEMSANDASTVRSSYSGRYVANPSTTGDANPES